MIRDYSYDRVPDLNLSGEETSSSTSRLTYGLLLSPSRLERRNSSPLRGSIASLLQQGNRQFQEGEVLCFEQPAADQSRVVLI